MKTLDDLRLESAVDQAVAKLIENGLIEEREGRYYPARKSILQPNETVVGYRTEDDNGRP